MEVVCKGCKTKYILREERVPYRDKDSLECEKCHTTIKTWNGGCVWHIVPEKSGNSQPDKE